MTTQTPQPSQLSPDGRFRWDGAGWVPVAQRAAAVLPAGAGEGSSKGLSVASLVLALLGLSGLGSVAGVVLGHVARRQDRREGRAPNRIALAGLVIGYVGIALLPLLAAVAIPVFLNQRVKAVEADLSAELRAVAADHETYRVDMGTYASNGELPATTTAVGSQGPVVVDVLAADAVGYCLRATSGDHVLYLDSDGLVVSEVPCG